MCDKASDEFVKKLIYKKKVVIFGYKDEDFTSKSIQFFKKNYDHNSENVFLDKIKTENKIEVQSLMKCLKTKSKSNVLPMIFVNGMYIGNYTSLSNYEYKHELDIFF